MVHCTNEDFAKLCFDLCGPDPGLPACEAIRAGDEQKVREFSLQRLPSWTPVIETVLQGRADFLELFLKNDDTIPECVVKDAMAAACERKDKACIRTLLNHGWDINQPICFRASILCFAIDDVEFMRWLIEIGADVDKRADFDEPVLSIAIAGGDIRVVRLLLELGADTRHGNLLHCAAQRPNQSEGAELIDYLAQTGLDTNAHRHNNPVALKQRLGTTLFTPLHVACRKGNVPAAKALLQHSADPDRMVLELCQPVPPSVKEMARETGDKEMIALLSRAAKGRL